MPSDADMAAALETANGAGARSMLHGVFALSLTCMAGYLDAVGYTHLAGLYVSFMSGNSTRLGLAIAEGDRKLLVPCAVVIIGFVAGAFIGSLIANAVSRFKLTAILATEIALLLSTIALSLDTASYAALLPICVAMGIQNPLMRRSPAPNSARASSPAFCSISARLWHIWRRAEEARLGRWPMAPHGAPFSSASLWAAWHWSISA